MRPTADTPSIVERLGKGTCLGMYSVNGEPTINYTEIVGAMSEAAAEIKRLYKIHNAMAKIIADQDATIRELAEALRKLLACPAIADGNHTSPVWGCYETAAAEDDARRLLSRLNLEGEKPHD